MNINLETFKQHNINYDWKTIYVGFKLKLIKSREITNYAVEFLTKHPETNNQNIIELAWGEDGIDHEYLLLNLMSDLGIDESLTRTDVWDLEKRKWRFNALVNLKMSYIDKHEELLNKIAEVYADFQYPEDMDNFIHYLPPKEGVNPTNYSQQENEIRLINLFINFLDTEHQYLQNV
ncbi:DUF2247 family protein [Gracilibacillus saliphilus]|uniref:DUF2247 family protein n=1 Tax=Gracilibacillus saliphilus TaxID=543890 RepID=UPI0013CFE2F0|nr:DUF2247 family protein [Gracilibacillus saliphilus]